MVNRLAKYLPESNRFERIWKLAQVDFKRRYYNDRFGILWAFINPVLRVLIYFVVFTYIIPRVRADVEGNFALFLFSALIFWIAFVEMIRRGMSVLKRNIYLMTNIQVNKVDLFISHGISSLLGFGFNLVAYIVIALSLGVSFSANAVWIIVIILNLYLLGLGMSMILAYIYIHFTDIFHVIDIFILLGFWTSGIFFPAKIILNIFPPLYYINPFLGMFENVRSLILYNHEINYPILVVNLTTGLVVYIIGIALIQKYGHLQIEKI